MDALALVLVFAGAFMLYEAIRNPHPTPVTKATAAVTGSSK